MPTRLGQVFGWLGIANEQARGSGKPHARGRGYVFPVSAIFMIWGKSAFADGLVYVTACHARDSAVTQVSMCRGSQRQVSRKNSASGRDVRACPDAGDQITSWPAASWQQASQSDTGILSASSHRPW